MSSSLFSMLPGDALSAARVALAAQQWGEAIRLAREALARDPDCRDAWLLLGEAHDANGHTAEALAALDHLRALIPASEVSARLDLLALRYRFTLRLELARELEANLQKLGQALTVEARHARAGKSASADEALRTLEQVTCFGLAERFDESVALLVHTFGWESPGSIERLNVAPRRLQRDEIPAHVLERIVELNAEDIELYGTAEHIFEQRVAALPRR